MTKRPIALLGILALSAGLTACQAPPVNHSFSVPSTTLPLPTSTSNTLPPAPPTPDLRGFYCWTERNTALPEGVEGICAKDLKKVPYDRLLHWGMPDKTDYHFATPEAKVADRFKGDDNQDGTIQEDESGWNCHTMGNHRCS